MPSPLGYVFWHRPRGGAVRGEYERRHSAFQQSLKAHPPVGLVDALSFRGGSMPWLKGRSPAYEDWYLVEGFQSLGALNEAVVDAANKRSHDEVAEMATVLAGGLYQLRKGGLPLRDALYGTWVRKPARTPYEAFLGSLSKLAGDRKTDLWQRQMVLGPAPEFCVHSEVPLDLPKAFVPATVRLRLVEARP